MSLNQSGIKPVSVIIPVHNGEQFLPLALESVINQTFPDIEIIVIDDGSTDKSSDIIKQYSTIDNRIKIIKKETASGGCFLPLKIGVQESTSEYVSFVAQDDIIDKDYIEKLYNRITSSCHRLDAVYPIFWITENNKKIFQIPDEQFDLNTVFKGPDALKYTLDGWSISTQGGLIRKSVCLKSFELLTNPTHSHSDELLGRYILLNSSHIGFCSTKYIYGENGQSVSRKASLRRYNYLLNTIDLVRIIQCRFGINSEEYQLIQQQLYHDYLRTIKSLGKTCLPNKDLDIIKSRLVTINRLLDYKTIKKSTPAKQYFLIRAFFATNFYIQSFVVKFL